MNLHISNLGAQVTEESLRATFATYGAIQSITLLSYKTAENIPGCAVIAMPNAVEAAAAVQRINGSIINGRRIKVEEAMVPAVTAPSYPMGTNVRN